MTGRTNSRAEAIHGPRDAKRHRDRWATLSGLDIGADGDVQTPLFGLYLHHIHRAGQFMPWREYDYPRPERRRRCPGDVKPPRGESAIRNRLRRGSPKPDANCRCECRQCSFGYHCGPCQTGRQTAKRETTR
jgi:hypothetical protein